MSRRREYHRAYYAANAEKRRAQKLASLRRLGLVHRYRRELIADDIKAGRDLLPLIPSHRPS